MDKDYREIGAVGYIIPNLGSYMTVFRSSIADL